MKVRGALLGAVVLAGVAAVARAEETITIELRSGEKVTGQLEGFADRVYKVKIGGQSLSFKEGDVRRIEFGEAGDAHAKKTPATTKTAAAEILSRVGDVKGFERGEIEAKDEDEARVVYKDRATATVLVERLTYTPSADAEKTRVMRGCSVVSGRLRATISERGAGVVSLAREALIAAISSALSGETRERAAVYPSAPALDLGIDAFALTRELLPEGLSSLELGQGKDSPFSNSWGAPARATYGGAGRSVEIEVHQGSSYLGSLQGPTKDYRYIWKAWNKGVTLKVAGDVPEPLVQWFVAFIEAELRHAKDTRDAQLLKAAAPAEAAPAAPGRDATAARGSVVAADLIGTIGEVKGLTRGRVKVIAKDEAAPLGDLSVAGVEDAALIEYLDRGKTAVFVARLKDDASTQLFISRSRRPLERATHRVKLVMARRLVAVILDDGSVAASVERLCKAVGAAFERAGATPAFADLKTAAPALDVAAFAFPIDLLPAGVPPAELEGTSPARAIYRPEGGSVEVHVWRHRSPPTADELKAYRHAWQAKQEVWNGLEREASVRSYPETVVAIRAESGAPEPLVAALVDLVRAELARVGAKNVTTLKGGDASSAPAKPHQVALGDLVPEEKELPAGFTVTKFRSDVLYSLPFRTEGSATLSLAERAPVDVLFARAADGDVSLDSFLAKTREVNRPGEVLHAGAVVVWIKETDEGSLSLRGMSDLAALLARKLEAAGLGAVKRAPVPVLHPRLGHRSLWLPAAQLPPGVSHDPAGTVAPVPTFARASERMLQRYRTGAAEVRLSIFQAPSGGSIGTPSAAELRAFRAAWLAETRAVTIETIGEVDAGTLEWFAKLVTDELARYSDTRDAKRLEIPKPRLLAADAIVPHADELPAWVSVSREDRRDGTRIASDVTYEVAQSPTRGPIYRDMHAGARDEVVIRYAERARLSLDARSYASVEKAAAASVATKRAAGVYFKGAREILVVENIVCVLEDQGATVAGWEAFRAAVMKRAAELGAVRSEKLPFEVQADVHRIPQIPDALLPAGWKRLPSESPAAVEKSILGATAASHLVEYGDSKGVVTIAGFVAKERGEPARDRLAAFRHAWLLEDGKTGFTIAVKGEVAPATAAWFARHVATELAHCKDGKTAKHLDVTKLPPPWKPSPGQIHVYSKTTPGGEKAPRLLVEVLEWQGKGGACTYRAWPEDLARGTPDVKKRAIELETARKDEEVETMTISGIRIACARDASGAVRALDPLLPLPVRFAEEGHTYELAEIHDPTSVHLDVAGAVGEATAGGTIVKQVLAGSRAERIGLEAGDRVILLGRGTDGKASVVVDRNGKVVTLAIVD